MDEYLSQPATPEGPAAPRGLRIVIAGGGTGGHLFPGIAVAQAFRERDAHTRVLFVGTGNRLEATALARSGFSLQAIAVEGLRSRGWRHQIRALTKIPGALRKSIRILKVFRPDLVLGVGGYSAGPVVAGAWLLHKPVAIQEQNIVPGLTNRLLAGLVDRIYVSFASPPKGFNPLKVVHSGNPVRPEMGRARQAGSTGIRTGHDPIDPFRVLVIGGSQGAHRINRAVVECLACLEDKQAYDFVHQTGTRDEIWVRRAYERHGVRARVQPFFTDMADCYQRADLVVGRAGATTVAEVTTVGRTMICIPFPQAAGNHQWLNACNLVAAGAAEMIIEARLSGDQLSRRFHYLRRQPAVLDRMAARARALGQPDAAVRIVADCYRLIVAGLVRAHPEPADTKE